MNPLLKPLFIILLFSVSTASAVVHFSTTDWSGYSDGDLTGQNGWLTLLADTDPEIQVSGNAVEWGDNTDIAYQPLGLTLGSGDSVYYAMHVTISAGNGVHALAGFRESGIVGTAAQLSVDLIGDGDFRFGISNTAAVSAGWASGSTYGQKYLVVVGYVFDSGIATMWLDPTGEGSTSISSVALSGQEITRFNFIPGDSDGTFHSVSSLAIADSFSGAMGAVAVPEPGSYALIFSSAILGLAAIRRRGIRRS